MIVLSDLRELFCLSENHRNMLTLPYKTERPERFLAQIIGLIHKYRFWEIVSMAAPVLGKILFLNFIHCQA